VTDRFLCGWRVASAILLPDLAPWRGDDRVPDLTIVFGSTPETLPGGVLVAACIAVGLDGSCLFTLRGFGRFLITGGTRVVVETFREVSEGELRVFLFGTVLSIVAHQRGLLPLHASAVRIGEGAVVLMGPSGAGKSSLASALARRGHVFLADDVAVIDTGRSEGPCLLPAFSCAKLWQDTVDSFGLDCAGLTENRPGQRKYHFPLSMGAAPFPQEPLPLHAIMVLIPPDGMRAPGMTLLRGPKAPGALLSHIKTRRVGSHLERKGAALAAALRVAGVARIAHFVRQSDLTRLDEDAETLERAILGDERGRPGGPR
jgi:hypothetical protein